MQADIVHELNDALGTEYELETSWQDILPEPEPSAASETLQIHASGASNGAATLLGGDLPSEDESDFSFRCIVGALRFVGARRVTMPGQGHAAEWQCPWFPALAHEMLSPMGICPRRHCCTAYYAYHFACGRLPLATYGVSVQDVQLWLRSRVCDA